MAGTGDEHTKLIVLRGNSGSGKSSTARAVRDRYGRGLAWVEQDHLRRIVLRERDVPGGVNIGLIAQTVRYALDHDYHVVLEGILYADHYASMLADLARDHRGDTAFYYFHVAFEETVRRHATRPNATEFSPEEMRDWYRDADLLDFVEERPIHQQSTLAETVDRIFAETALEAGPKKVGAELSSRSSARSTR